MDPATHREKLQDVLLCAGICLRPETESSGTSISLYAGVKCLTQSVDTGQISSQLMTRMSKRIVWVSGLEQQFTHLQVCFTERTVNRPFRNIYIFGNINNKSL